MSFPDAESLVLALSRAALPGVAHGTFIPADLTKRLPFVVIRRVGGQAVDPRFVDRPSVDVQCWAGTREGARDAANAVRTALLDAWDRQTVTPHGHISYYTETSSPVELRDSTQPDNVWRYQALYSLIIRNETE